jgi:2-desacetyl-2-hydroxyethyl bacteriochlorophyllide A dehydrogenase
VRELPAERLELSDIPELYIERDDEVLVEVESCGVCGTDLHILAGVGYRPSLPFVLGHEPVGHVVDAGPSVPGWIGRRVTATLFEGCGCCAWCANGHERLCPRLRSILGVLARNGGFAQRFSVAVGQLVPVPDTLASDQAAVLVDAGATAMNAARAVLKRDHPQIVIAGGGPVGMLVAQLLTDVDRAPVVIEPSTPRRLMLAANGHQVAESLDDVDSAFDCVVDCSGSPQVPGWALSRLNPRGLLVVAGYAIVPQADYAPVARKELTVRGVRSGSRTDLENMLVLAASQRISLPPVHAWPLEDINEALSALRRGSLDGKAVIHPGLGDRSHWEAHSWTSSSSR